MMKAIATPKKNEASAAAFVEARDRYMCAALSEALDAFDAGEVPVGAVLVRGDTIVARAHNECATRHDPTAHAELLCLQAGLSALSGRLTGCTLYVTMEPCPMCMGAALNAKLPRLVFGAFDARAGCCGSVLDLADHCFLHTIEVWGGVRQTECAALLTSFFRERRTADEKTHPAADA